MRATKRREGAGVIIADSSSEDSEAQECIGPESLTSVSKVVDPFEVITSNDVWFIIFSFLGLEFRELLCLRISCSKLSSIVSCYARVEGEKKYKAGVNRIKISLDRLKVGNYSPGGEETLHRELYNLKINYFRCICAMRIPISDKNQKTIETIKKTRNQLKKLVKRRSKLASPALFNKAKHIAPIVCKTGLGFLAFSLLCLLELFLIGVGLFGLGVTYISDPTMKQVCEIVSSGIAQNSTFSSLCAPKSPPCLITPSSALRILVFDYLAWPAVLLLISAIVILCTTLLAALSGYVALAYCHRMPIKKLFGLKNALKFFKEEAPDVKEEAPDDNEIELDETTPLLGN